MGQYWYQIFHTFNTSLHRYQRVILKWFDTSSLRHQHVLCACAVHWKLEYTKLNERGWGQSGRTWLTEGCKRGCCALPNNYYAFYDSIWRSIQNSMSKLQKQCKENEEKAAKRYTLHQLWISVLKRYHIDGIEGKIVGIVSKRKPPVSLTTRLKGVRMFAPNTHL